MSSRFKYLFIDEMQDTQSHQLEIIDKIFNNTVVKQYYRDPDQGIFDGLGGGISSWEIEKSRKLEIEKSRKLEITDSKRFGKSISDCIYNFRREISKVDGTSKKSLKPNIILYDNEKDALRQFAN